MTRHRICVASLMATAMVALSATAFCGETVVSQESDGTRVPIPPGEHPRLYLRAEHVAQLPQRLRSSTH